MKKAITIAPLPGAGLHVRLLAWLRGLISRRQLLRLAGVSVVQLQGRVYAIRPVPLGTARELVPAIMRCSQRFAAMDFDEALYDDLVKVLSLGLGAPASRIESLTVSLFDLAPLIERIARTNGLLVLEAGSPELGKLLRTLAPAGTSFTPGLSAARAGPGDISTKT